MQLESSLRRLLRRQLYVCPVVLTLLFVPAPGAAGAQVVLREFLAANASGLLDADGDESDWIELENQGSEAVDLGGWYLSDRVEAPRRWRLPGGTALGAGEFLVVFASGKDRRDPAGELHTSFRLEADGEYLGLIEPDGVTVAHEYAPAYPPQRDDVSYGLAERFERTELVGPDAAVRVASPREGDEPRAWTEPEFDDSEWRAGQGAVGFDLDDTGGGDGPANLALGARARQSSTGFAGFASRAVDGDTDGAFDSGTVTHTSPNDPSPFWEVDLGAVSPVARIVLWNRIDACCRERLSNFRLQVRGEADDVVHASDHFTGGDAPEGPSYAIELPPGVQGRYVRIEKLGPDANGETILSLAEVEVFGLPAGFGALLGLDVAELLHGVSASVHARVPFADEGAGGYSELWLLVRYDDGFAAYLNGILIAARNAPEAPAWDSTATAEREDSDAVVFERIAVPAGLAALRPGANVLAVLGLNAAAGDRDLLLEAHLVAVRRERLEPRYFLESSPGERGDDEGVSGFVADTTFSRDRGFFAESFEVEITSGSEGAEIRYTTDGSAPTRTEGRLYTGALRIETTTVLRARAFLDGYAPTNIDTQTYIFPAHVVRQRGDGFPPRWGTTAADYEMDPNVVGDPLYRDTIADDIRVRIPTLSVVTDEEDLFGARGLYTNPEGRGLPWERPASMEIIYPDGGDGIQVDCGLRIFGFGWRAHTASLKHAFRLVFKRRYGPPKLRHRFFPDFPVEEFDNIVLRSQGSRGWNDFRVSIEQTQYIRDAWARYTARDMGKLTTSSTYVHLYLNGLYWGLYNPVERPDAEFMVSHLGGEPEEYDALNARVGNIEVIDGSRDAWDELIRVVRGPVEHPEALADVAGYLDLEDFVDYLLINLYTGNRDWVGANGNNMRVAGGPGAAGGFKCFCWDMEYSIWGAGDNALGVVTQYPTPALIFARLRGNEEFRVVFGDLAHRHLTGGGALTPARAAARWMDRAAEIDRAIVGESARWGDRRREPPYTRDREWLREQERLLETFFPQRTDIFIEQLRRIGLFPALEAPRLATAGGAVEAGFRLAIEGPADAGVLYTLDGSDPRQPGGEVLAAARLYDGPIAIEASGAVRARALAGDEWSALVEAEFVIMSPLPLRVTEIMYHPRPPESGPFDAEEFEFVEITNVGTRAVDLAGVRVSEGVDFLFGAGAGAGVVLDAGASLLLVRNVEAFVARYDIGALTVAGEYARGLSNREDTLRLEDAAGRTIHAVAYRDDWHPSTDGEGRSLEAVDALAPPERFAEPAGWRPSDALDGSPGVAAGAAAGALRGGDANGDGRINLSDAAVLLGALFGGAASELACGDGTLADASNRARLDLDGNGGVDLSDAVHIVRYLFLAGPPPVAGTGCVSLPRCPLACSPE